MTWSKHVWPVWVVGLVLLGAAPARAQPETEAQRRYQAAMKLYAGREFAAAARELAVAYALEARREFLFAEAQATRLAGDCPAALPLYEQFLATAPPPQQVDATRIAMGRCQVGAAPRPDPLPAAAGRGDRKGELAGRPVPAMTVAAAPVVIVRPGPPFYRDRVGGVLAGAGVAVAAVGVGVLVSAANLDAEARRQGQLDAFAGRRDQAERRWRLGLGAVVAGAALVAAGAGRYWWVSAHAAGVGGRF